MCRAGRAGRAGWWPKLSCLVAAIIILGAWNLTQSWRLNRVSLLFPKDSERHVLVLYIFAATDPQFIENLRYFVKEAVQHDTECEYVIVIQQSPTDKAHWVRISLLPCPWLPPRMQHARLTCTMLCVIGSEGMCERMQGW